MLLRKPFKFLIKYFKLIHLILTLLTIYIVFRTNEIFRFISEYLSSNMNVVGTTITDTLFSPIIIVALIIILIISFIVLGLMSFKKKPIILYIYNILVYIFVICVYIYSYSTIKTLEIGLVGIRTLKIIQDLTVTSLVLQAISLLMVSVRATGFNIKKFDFNDDLEDLQITNEDNEEFEVVVELDTDEFRRNIRKKLRHAKYVYIENKFVFNITVLLNIALVLFIIYINSGVYHKIYNQNEAFKTTEYMINIQNSYVTNKDYNENQIIEKKQLVVVQFNIRSIMNITKKKFTVENFSLNIKNNVYFPIDKYFNEIYDIGTLYRKQYITTNFSKYIMVFEIPESQKKEPMLLKYNDINNKNIDIALKSIKDETKNIIGTYTLNQEFDIKNTVYKDTKVKIKSAEIEDTFISPYKYCLSDNNCISGNEYIKPNIADNYDKTLLKLTGYANQKDNELVDLYKLFKDFGTIIYEKNNQEFIMKLNFNQIKPTKNSDQEVYYIEVANDIKNSDKIKIAFKLRDNIYEVIVK